MEVVLLGTGSADGWPSAFCRCASCLAMRREGVLRTPTSVLVDGRIWIDPGPEAPRQALRCGVDLVDVDTILVGHAHTDHLDPSFLLHRSWVDERPLTVYGPAAVISRCRDWLDPQQQAVRLVEVTAGDDLPAGDHTVRVIEAAHEAFGEAVLYRITDGHRRILYACDTGAWADGALDRLAGERLDLVLLEETFGDRFDLAADHHHGFATFEQAVADLHRREIVDERSRIVAVHLSHHNPPDVAARLAALGAETGHDGARLRLA